MIRHAAGFPSLSVRGAVLTALLLGTSAGRASGGTASDRLDRIRPLADALVWVEYDIVYDGNEAPRGIGWGEVCPNCGRIHGDRLEQRVISENPVRTPGFLVRTDRVLTSDLQVHPRFVRAIHAVVAGQRRAARPIAFSGNHPAVLLALDEPVPHVRAPTFDPRSIEPPLMAVSRAQLNGIGQLVVQEIGANITTPEYGNPFVAVPPAALIVDAKGTPAGIRLNGELPLDDGWKGDPLEDAGWDWIDPQDMAARQLALEDALEAGIVHVALHFRSPRPSGGEGMMRSWRMSRPFGPSVVDEDVTEHHAVGIVTAPDRVLVLAGLIPSVTARLERILIHRADGTRVQAAFAGSYKDYAALMVTPESPIDRGIQPDFTSPAELRHRLLLGADIHVAPGQREIHVCRVRLNAFRDGRRGQLVPELPNAGESLFLFDGDRLLAMPMRPRDRLSAMQTGRRYFRGESVLHPLEYWESLLADPAPHLDAGNVPRDPGEEQRLAWLGVELQPMDYELAMLHGVLRQTEDGQSGAVVTHVYPGSPAERGDLQVGDILLRLTTPGVPVPIPLRMERSSSQRDFQWELLDRMPDAMFEQVNPPWPEPETPLTRLLTDLGEGTELTLDFVRGDTPLKIGFQVEMGPLTYASAPRLRMDAIGITVRDLSYEVRHFLQREAGDPGVVVSRIEPGGRASVAGIRPYELITHVNGQSVASIAEFAAAMAEPGGKQLAVQRMAISRLVRIPEWPDG